MTKIAGQEFLLPLKSELHSKDGRYSTKNETEFRNYNKYGTESSITFDVPDALPADQTQEQPVAAGSTAAREIAGALSYSFGKGFRRSAATAFHLRRANSDAGTNTMPARNAFIVCCNHRRQPNHPLLRREIPFHGARVQRDRFFACAAASRVYNGSMPCRYAHTLGIHIRNLDGCGQGGSSSEIVNTQLRPNARCSARTRTIAHVLYQAESAMRSPRAGRRLRSPSCRGEVPIDLLSRRAARRRNLFTVQPFDGYDLVATGSGRAHGGGTAWGGNPACANSAHARLMTAVVGTIHLVVYDWPSPL